MSIIDQLVANPGVYLGIGRDPGGERGQAARIEVTPLPNGAGVTIDYETFNPANENRLQPHREHAVIGRLEGGGAILVSGHAHAGTVAVLRETSPGEFTMGDEPAAFPMAISISVPEPGRLVYVWSYGPPGGEPEPRDHAELTLRP
jgi:RecB family exonuclease